MVAGLLVVVATAGLVVPAAVRPGVRVASRARPGHDRRRAPVIWALVLSACVLAGCSDADRPAGDRGAAAGRTTSTAEEVGRQFLADYVDDSGRVVRHDQGGDTVSEGQAYGMLVAAGIGDRDAFQRIWSWTADNLQRPDGLLSWRWADGAVVDPSAAADADLDAARALVVAGERFDDAGLTAEGIALGEAVLDLETVETAAGRVLVAGDWATPSPYAYNPSYPSPAATAVLAEASGDPRWAELDAGSRAVTAALLEVAALPPDWALVQRNGEVEPTAGALGRGSAVVHGYDAARVPIRFAESCHPADRALVAEMAEPLRAAGGRAELDLGGRPLTEDRSVVATMAQAAVAAVGEDRRRAIGALAEADDLARANSTYYGAAWNALGRLVLTDDVLGGCPPIDDAP